MLPSSASLRNYVYRHWDDIFLESCFKVAGKPLVLGFLLPNLYGFSQNEASDWWGFLSSSEYLIFCHSALQEVYL